MDINMICGTARRHNLGQIKPTPHAKPLLHHGYYQNLQIRIDAKKYISRHSPDYVIYLSTHGFSISKCYKMFTSLKIESKKCLLPSVTVWNLIFPLCDILLQLVLFSWHWVTSLLMRIEATAWADDLKRKLSSFQNISSHQRRNISVFAVSVQAR